MFICEREYHFIGSGINLCGGWGAWIPLLPRCEGKYLRVVFGGIFEKH